MLLMMRQDDIRDDLVDAAVKVLADEGASALRVRRVAQVAGVSTMAVYSRFGDMASLLEAVYVAGFDGLRSHLTLTGSERGVDRLVELALAYRRFALSNPALFALMFERPIAGFDPSIDARNEALANTFGILEKAVAQAQAAGELATGDTRDVSYYIWTGVHGTTSLEATYRSRTPHDDGIVGTELEGAGAVVGIVRALCAGLS